MWLWLWLCGFVAVAVDSRAYLLLLYQCTTDTCDSGTCNNAAVSEGTSCGGSNVCSAAGACVECNSATDCDDSDPVRGA